MNQSAMSQIALAEKSGSSKAAISQYLSGKNIPGEAKMQALAAALGVTEEFLKGEAPTNEVPPDVTRIGTSTAARCMGKSAQFVRIGLQKGILPFGNAVPTTEKRWDYYINPSRFREYVGEKQFDAFFGQKARG